MDETVTQLYSPDTLIMPSFSWEWGRDNKLQLKQDFLHS